MGGELTTLVQASQQSLARPKILIRLTRPQAKASEGGLVTSRNVRNVRWPAHATPSSTSPCTRMRPRLQPASSLITLPHILTVANLPLPLPLPSELLSRRANRRVPSLLSGLWRGLPTRRCLQTAASQRPQNDHSGRLLPFAPERRLGLSLPQPWKTSLSHPTVATTLPSRSPWRTGRMRAAGPWTTSSTSALVIFPNSSNNCSAPDG